MRSTDARHGVGDGPAQVVEKTLKYREADEHLLRRLASALILHWDEVGDDLQDLLLEQATVVEDREDIAITQGQIEDFVRRVKAIALRRRDSAKP